MSDLFCNVLNQLSCDDKLAWCMSFWSIWSSHNQHVWNNVRNIVASIIIRGSQLLFDWVAAHNKSPSVSSVASASMAGGAHVHWQKPPTDFVMCNVDAAFDSGGSKAGFRMFLRDENDIFLAAKTFSFSPII